MDYYKLRNVQADTDMRTAIARISAPASATNKKGARGMNDRVRTIVRSS